MHPSPSRHAETRRSIIYFFYHLRRATGDCLVHQPNYSGIKRGTTTLMTQGAGSEDLTHAMFLEKGPTGSAQHECKRSAPFLSIDFLITVAKHIVIDIKPYNTCLPYISLCRFPLNSITALTIAAASMEGPSASNKDIPILVIRVSVQTTAPSFLFSLLYHAPSPLAGLSVPASAVRPQLCLVPTLRIIIFR